MPHILSKQWAFLGLTILFLSGCTINRDIMFSTGDNFDFSPLEEMESSGYRIAPNDMLQFRLFTNKGQRLNQMTAGAPGGSGGGNQQMNQQMNQQGGMSYLVKPDGLIELPELGNIRLEGLTLEEAEELLEEAYASYYNEPYVILRILNNRVYIFPGESGRASVVTLVNMNTTLLEVLAMTGGIGNRANASKVKLIRRTASGNEVYKMDLSTIDGIGCSECGGAGLRHHLCRASASNRAGGDRKFDAHCVVDFDLDLLLRVHCKSQLRWKLKLCHWRGF